MLDIVVELGSAEGSSGMVSYSFTSSCTEEIGIKLNPKSASTWVGVNTDTDGEVKFTTLSDNEKETPRTCTATPVVNNIECDDKAFKVTQKGKEIPKCIIQVIATGNEEGDELCIFECNGIEKPSVLGQYCVYELDQEASGGTIHITNLPSSTWRTDKEDDKITLHCGESGQVEITKLKDIFLSISEVSTSRITFEATEAEGDEIGVSLSFFINYAKRGGGEATYSNNATLGCGSTVDFNLSEVIPDAENIISAEITDYWFNDNHEKEECTQGTYICYELKVI